MIFLSQESKTVVAKAIYKHIINNFTTERKNDTQELDLHKQKLTGKLSADMRLSGESS